MKGFFRDFKKFITKGNVVDLAVAVIIGNAFNAIVTSLVKDVITPLISLATGNVDFTNLHVVLRPASDTLAELTLNYGMFLQKIIDFLIIGLTIFVMVKVYSKITSSMDINANFIKSVQQKLDNDEPLTKIEEKWLKKFSKRYPDLAPKKQEVVVEEPKVEEPTKTEALLTEILEELKKNNESKSAKK
ncbi:MAG: large conductance mechanosensitive channel protein MscL [Clostridia bacterium]|nr:large conductance mechanosensitive channel protein MscL [Clostridia bacterium]